jgi:hypothetical protein
MLEYFTLKNDIVVDHTYRRMLRLDVYGRNAVWNIDMHDLIIQPDSILQASMKPGVNRTTVNSVHWKAVNPAQTPLNVRVTANAVANPKISNHNSHSRLMDPVPCVEAFESNYGAPIIGTQ